MSFVRSHIAVMLDSIRNALQWIERLCEDAAVGFFVRQRRVLCLVRHAAAYRH